MSYKFHFHPSWADDTLKMTMIMDAGYGQKRCIARKIEFSEIVLAEVAPTLLSLSHEDAQDMIDQLYAAGIRPSKEFGSNSQIDALKYHLEDMRKLVFSDLVR